MAFSRIVVRPKGAGKSKKFILFNEASNAPCGDRNYIGEDGNDRKQAWPFWGLERWWEYGTKDEADKACDRLQRYLTARENQLLKNRNSNKKKRHAQEF